MPRIMTLKELLRREGCEVTKAPKSLRTGLGVRKAIGHPSLLGNPDKIREALGHIPNEYHYDDWIRMCAAIKASLGGDNEHYEIFEDWCMGYPNDIDDIRDKWDSIYEAEIGAEYIYDIARSLGYQDAHEQFASVEPDELDDIGIDYSKQKAIADMYEHYVWFKEFNVFIDTRTGEFMKDKVFNRLLVNVASETARKTASVLYSADLSRRRVMRGITYRPGAEVIIEEQGELYYNNWRPSTLVLPSHVTEDMVTPWLELMTHVVPDDSARKVILDWLAYTVQHPEEKINWAPLIGSNVQGIGKGLALKPVIEGLGSHNVSEVGPTELASPFNPHLDSKKLIVVEEMQTLAKNDQMNRMKALISAPPHELIVNKKNVSQYAIPNIINLIFFTNKHNAVAVERHDRRFFVYWSPAQANTPAFYKRVAEYYENGGYGMVVQWLMQRDLSGFNAKGHAPYTKHKGEMYRAALDPLAEWIESGIEDEAPPFQADIVSVRGVTQAVPKELIRYGPKPSKIAHLLSNCGAHKLGRIRTSGVRDTLYAIRRQSNYQSLTDNTDALREAYLSITGQDAFNDDVA